MNTLVTIKIKIKFVYVNKFSKRCRGEFCWYRRDVPEKRALYAGFIEFNRWFAKEVNKYILFTMWLTLRHQTINSKKTKVITNKLFEGQNFFQH